MSDKPDAEEPKPGFVQMSHAEYAERLNEVKAYVRRGRRARINLLFGIIAVVFFLYLIHLFFSG